MHRRRVLAVAGTVALAGCSQTSDPPSYPPDADFNVTFERSMEGDTVILVHAGGEPVPAANVRLTIGERRVYENGEIRGGYDDGPHSRNEWAETVRPGDQLVLSNGGYLPPWRELSLEARSNGGQFYGMARGETPRPAMKIGVTRTRIEDTTYITITHKRGDTFEAEATTVSLGGQTVFRRGELTDAVAGPETRNEWENGVEPGDRLRIPSDQRTPAGVPVIVYYNLEPDRLRLITDATVPDGHKTVNGSAP